MKKNYNDLIKDKQKRTLTAKGYKFLSRCIDIACRQRGLTRYHKEMKPLKDSLTLVLHDLIIDKEFTIEQIKEVVKKRFKLVTS